MNQKDYLIELANRYETCDFIVGDPSWFMHQLEDPTEQELMAFISASLSYGSRKQFMPKIQFILDESGGKLSEWLVNGSYNDSIPPSPECFYRLYTKQMYNNFLRALGNLLKEHGSLRVFVENNKKTKEILKAIDVINAITQWFADNGSNGVIPINASSSCKRLCMFLRWMVRTDSPVDLGLWNDLIDSSSLIIPMDVHVVQESIKLGLLSSKCTSMSNAIKLTEKLARIWPNDPTKGDFALFGIGVDTNK